MENQTLSFSNISDLFSLIASQMKQDARKAPTLAFRSDSGLDMFFGDSGADAIITRVSIPAENSYFEFKNNTGKDILYNRPRFNEVCSLVTLALTDAEMQLSLSPMGANTLRAETMSISGSQGSMILASDPIKDNYRNYDQDTLAVLFGSTNIGVSLSKNDVKTLIALSKSKIEEDANSQIRISTLTNDDGVHHVVATTSFANVRIGESVYPFDEVVVDSSMLTNIEVTDYMVAINQDSNRIVFSDLTEGGAYTKQISIQLASKVDGGYDGDEEYYGSFLD